jgi:hypothetical protein
MKTKVTLLAIALATLQSVALAQQTPDLSGSTPAVDQKKIHVTTPLSAPPVNPFKVPVQTEINRVGNVSSRPWTEIVGWHNGQSVSWNGEDHEPQFCVLSLGY